MNRNNKLHIQHSTIKIMLITKGTGSFVVWSSRLVLVGILGGPTNHRCSEFAYYSHFSWSVGYHSWLMVPTWTVVVLLPFATGTSWTAVVLGPFAWIAAVPGPFGDDAETLAKYWGFLRPLVRNSNYINFL